MLKMHVIFIFAFVLPAVIVLGQNSDCKNKASCQDCIQEVDCVWCITPKNPTENHCMHKAVVSKDWCPNNLIISPVSSQKILQDLSFSSDTQFKPQHIKLSLRKGEKVQVPFQYHPAENYPVDLYYLMDLSNSMDAYRKQLGELGVKLARALQKLTSNVRLGFGSFIDKVDLPFVSTVKSKLDSPCKGCAPPYSFVNHLKLSDNFEKFKMEVTGAHVSGNLDSPEGGLDAIMQAIVCKKEIGWRKQARHLLVFSTDDAFHIAGDGKLAGVIEPNDAKCHMVDNNYTEFLKYDYPSVSQINYVAKENNINIIFAIVKKYADTTNSYKMLSQQIENSNFGELENTIADKENVVNLVVKNYKKIVQSVTMTSNATNDVDVKFSSMCPNPKPNGCNNVHVGENVDFVATIQARECSNGGSNRKIISIKPKAVEESLIIELEVLCNCPCSLDNAYPSNATECSRNGYLECGICKCLPGRFGKTCECDSSASSSEDTINCKMNEQADICSGQGDCICGICQCKTRQKPEEKIEGKFCECNNYSCKKDNGILCSGKGNCNCGECKCHAGYTGDYCQCPESVTTCIAPGSDTECSGNGNCICGKCECTDRYFGDYCEECTTCPTQRCEELRHCVECQAYQTGIYDKSECESNCTAFNTTKVDKVSTDDDTKKCRKPDKDGCIIIFEYSYDENKKLIVRAQKEKLCAGPPNVLAWILGVIGTILIAGLIMLIIWKVFTTVHDRREYAKFENERKALKWHRNDNPLYRDAVSTFANPVYNRSTSRLPSK